MGKDVKGTTPDPGHGELGLVVGDRDASQMALCVICARVRGRWRYALEEFADLWFVQRCRCEDRDEPLWPRFDYNTSVELCWCCAAEPLQSGSRWSNILCPECKQRALGLVRPDGRLVVPIGRHSLMNRVSLPLDEVWSRPSTVPVFAERLGQLAGGITWLWEWGERRTKANLAAIRDGVDGLGEGDKRGAGAAAGDGPGGGGPPGLPLATYVERVAAIPLDKEAVFASMCGELVAAAEASEM